MYSSDEKSHNPYHDHLQQQQPQLQQSGRPQSDRSDPPPYEFDSKSYPPSSGPPPSGYGQQQQYQQQSVPYANRGFELNQGYGQPVYQPPPGPPPPQGYGAPPPQGYGGYGQPGQYPSQSPSYGQGQGGPGVYSPFQGPPQDGGYYQGASSSAQHGPSPMGEGTSLASFFGNGGPPPMWQRPPPAQLPFNQFPPMCLISNTRDITKGFPELPPPCNMQPHPFATHDISEEDWRRFLVDIKKAGSLSGMQRIKSNVLPSVMGVGLLGGIFMTNRIERRMKFRNRSAAGDIVDHWNHYFFGPRRMEAVLSQSSERLSGREGSAPMGSAEQERMARKLRHRADDSDSSSDSDSDHGHHHGPQLGFRSDRRARRFERREGRRQRKAERRAARARGDYEEPYKLWIMPA